MSGRGSSGDRDTEDTWPKPWWIPLSAVVMLTISWGVGGLIEGGCERGPRGGCVAADGYEWHGWVLFLMWAPTLLVTIMGLVTDRWPPALGLALGTVSGGIYTLTHGQTAAHVAFAVFLFALAATSLSLTGYRTRRKAHRRSQEAHRKSQKEAHRRSEEARLDS